jgi:lysophospholipid acyltransferase (LPLAT)-like uncharacterized protein
MAIPDNSAVIARAPFKERAFLYIMEHIGPHIIRILGLLCRYRIDGIERLEAIEAEGNGVIIALWHGRMLLPVYHLRDRSICALVSLHRDGEMITRIVQKLGYIVRRGSPKVGGREGFTAMLRDLKAGRTVAIFPDGPTGPRHSLRDGILHLARLSGSPIIPITYSARPAWRAHSWDRFMIMKPFAKGLFLLGEPFTIPRRLDEKEAGSQREIIRAALIGVEIEADLRVGYQNEEETEKHG